MLHPSAERGYLSRVPPWLRSALRQLHRLERIGDPATAAEQTSLRILIAHGWPMPHQRPARR